MMAELQQTRIALVNRFITDTFVRLWPGLQRPIVQVRQGHVQGVTSKLPDGSPYHYFKGIPYAKPPIGDLRFRPPVPLEQFIAPVQKCLVDKSDFIQPDQIYHGKVIGTENGLHLNVFTPKLPSEGAEKVPVMVYIHGGGMRHGTASNLIYDPRYFIQQGVIVVSIYYRLGPFGFLCMPSVGINGNFGLKDQRLALKWIHDNIEKFGGNPENVTLFGESAGAWSTYLHYLSPNSRKYFHRVICQSGDFCTEANLQTNPTAKAHKLARLVGCNGSSEQEVLDCLRRAPAKLLAKYQDAVMSDQEKGLHLKFMFTPVIEQENSEDAILCQSPEKILKLFDTIQMPIINGCTDGEGILALHTNKRHLKKFDQTPEWLVPQMMGHPVGLNRKIVGEQIKQFYLGTKNIGRNTVNETRDLFTDSTFITTSNLSSELLAKYQPNATQYHYLFSYSGKFSVPKSIYNLDHVKGACHGDDCFYMFSPIFLPKYAKGSEEALVRNTFVNLWTNFAKHGDPTPNTNVLGFKWAPVAPVDRKLDTFDLDCLEINVESKMIRNPFQQRKEFWRNLIKRYTNYI